MEKNKKGLVLLPFLDKNQLIGFINQECINKDVNIISSLWEEKQSCLARIIKEEQSIIPSFEQMNEEDHEKYFLKNKFFNQYKNQKKDVLTGWLSNFAGVVPLKPFVALDGCEERFEEYIEKGVHSICLQPRKAESVAKLSISHENNGFTFSMLTKNRNLQINGVNIEKNQVDMDMRFTVFIGRPSPFIEIIECNNRYYLVNGLHRLFALLKGNVTEPIPCVLICEDPSAQLNNHPYQMEVFQGERPPIMADFLNRDVTYEFELETGLKQIQVFSKEQLILTDF